MKIAVLVSGGVDSSVALRLLKDQGHELTAFYLKIWLEDELSYLGHCPWQEDLDYVEKVCEQAGVPLKVISLQKQYSEIVVAYTMEEIKRGRTPNPDILCNQRIKFGLFFDYIDTSFDKVASGHYAQVQEKDNTFILLQSPDAIKDQTYFLSFLNQSQLARALFPIGHLTKTQVRALAQSYNLPNKERKDSQGICFLGKLKFNDFIAHHLGKNPGDLIEFETGKKLGTHQGFWFHTIGQRQGSGLSGGPWYVVAKDAKANIVYVSRNYYCSQKQRSKFTVEQCNWVIPPEPKKNDIKVKIRHGKELYSCTLVALDAQRWQVILDQNDQGIAPGQFAVFYDNRYCMGAGIICEQ